MQDDFENEVVVKFKMDAYNQLMKRIDSVLDEQE
jgi:hypothetical protein